MTDSNRVGTARRLFNPVSPAYKSFMNGLCSVTVSIEACGASGPGSSPGIAPRRLRPPGSRAIFASSMAQTDRNGD